MRAAMPMEGRKHELSGITVNVKIAFPCLSQRGPSSDREEDFQEAGRPELVGTSQQQSGQHKGGAAWVEGGEGQGPYI